MRAHNRVSQDMAFGIQEIAGGKHIGFDRILHFFSRKENRIGDTGCFDDVRAAPGFIPF